MVQAGVLGESKTITPGSSIDELLDKYLSKSKYAKKLKPDELVRKKNKLYNLLLEVGKTKLKDVEEVLSLYQSIPLWQNAKDLPDDANLLDAVLREEEWVYKPDALEYLLEKYKKEGGKDFRIILHYHNGVITSGRPDYKTKYSTLKAVAKYLGDTL